MTISNIEEIKCPNGHIFEAQLLSAISISENPELKEVLIAGEINLVSCPECGEMFYAECFILYHDSKNELIAFVYPLSFQNQAAQCKMKMCKEFELALENFEEKQKIKYEPLLLFGIEDLIILLRSEQDIEDEEMILKYLASKILLDTIKIVPSLARKLGIPKVLPVPKGEKSIETKSLISGLQILIKHNANLQHYIEFLDKISKHKTIIADLKK
ncbi:MAG: CpXC domain-containing protein [Endomicrobium sp.]|jgi:hypothetical protein|nr:CpXC domain-containing protein [Endomicrobium sp.]